MAGDAQLSLWIGSGPAHQTFLDAGGRIVLRAGPTSTAAIRDAIREPLAKLAPVLRGTTPGLPVLLEDGSAAEVPYLVQEDPRGRTVSNVWGPLDPRLALRIASLVLEALQPLHEAGLFHGALGPGRVVLAGGAAPFLAETGAALVAQAAAERPLAPTTPGFSNLWDDPAFVAPELLRTEALSPAADVFGASALAWRLAAGRPAHRAARALDVYARVRKGDHASFADLSGVPLEVALLADRALRPDPRDRPPADELREAFARASEGASALALAPPRPDEPGYSEPWSSTRAARRPEDAPGPPGSEAEERRQKTLRQAAIALETRRRPPREAPSRGRIGLLTFVVVLLGLLLLLMTATRK